MAKITIPAAEGRAFLVKPGQSFRIITPKGGQAADFFAYNAASIAEWLSPPHTWIATRSVRPREGDVLLSRFRRPMLRITEDGADGIHDMLLPAYDQFRYEFFGHIGPHASCSENLMTAMRRLGRDISVVPQPVNFFTNTHVDAEGGLSAPANTVRPGGYIKLEALLDLVCVVSSCPFDIKPPDWEVNRGGQVTELEMEVS